jgi:SAM-dependent methyltransferase
MTDSYCIKPGYVHRPKPEYFADSDSGIVWQPDVYVEACRIAGAVGATTIVDVGCGEGRKLAPLYPTFSIIGFDFGPNLEHCRRQLPFGRWIEHDFDTEGPLPIEPEALDGAVVICSDVLEHVVRPERLLGKLRGALDHAAAVVLSTPERVETWGADHMGPPPNSAHVREWALAELGELLEREGFPHGVVGLTRSNDHANQMATILARLFVDEDLAERACAPLRAGVPAAG